VTSFKRSLCASALAAGIGITGLLGTGPGTAAAEPGPQCNAPNRPTCAQDHHDNRDRNDNRGPAPANWQGRGVDQGRQDHQPFNWNGQQVTPMPAGNGQGWGFWFLGLWIPL
jgi:hypothetical protein